MRLDPRCIVFSGYLVKSPPLSKVKNTLARWKLRWFVLYDTLPKCTADLEREVELIYYKNQLAQQTGEAPLGIIDLTKVSKITQKEKGLHGHPYVLNIETTTRTYHICSTSIFVFNSWRELLTEKTFEFSALNGTIRNSGNYGNSVVEFSHGNTQHEGDGRDFQGQDDISIHEPCQSNNRMQMKSKDKRSKSEYYQEQPNLSNIERSVTMGSGESSRFSRFTSKMIKTVISDPDLMTSDPNIRERHKREEKKEDGFINEETGYVNMSSFSTANNQSGTARNRRVFSRNKDLQRSKTTVSFKKRYENHFLRRLKPKALYNVSDKGKQVEDDKKETYVSFDDSNNEQDSETEENEENRSDKKRVYISSYDPFNADFSGPRFDSNIFVNNLLTNSRNWKSTNDIDNEPSVVDKNNNNENYDNEKNLDSKRIKNSRRKSFDDGYSYNSPNQGRKVFNIMVSQDLLKTKLKITFEPEEEVSNNQITLEQKVQEIQINSKPERD